MIYCDDVENPVWVSDSIKAFFDLMKNNQLWKMQLLTDEV